MMVIHANNVFFFGHTKYDTTSIVFCTVVELTVLNMPSIVNIPKYLLCVALHQHNF